MRRILKFFGLVMTSDIAFITHTVDKRVAVCHLSFHSGEIDLNKMNAAIVMFQKDGMQRINDLVKG